MTLDILKNFGVRHKSLYWFQSYLVNKHFVELYLVNNFNELINFCSELRTLKYGIPQGCILGPLLIVCNMKIFVLT